MNGQIPVRHMPHVDGLIDRGFRDGAASNCVNLLPAQNVLSGHTSYGMKHILESRTGSYMTNNQFKEAMMECGFFPVVVDELNWRFRIKKSSPMFTIQTDGKCGLPMLGEPMKNN